MKTASRLVVFTALAVFGAASLSAAELVDENQPRAAQNPLQSLVSEDPLDAFKPMSDIKVDIRIMGEDVLPTDASGNLFTPPQRYSRDAMGWGAWPEVDFTWEVSELLYQPLYFDDAPLELYGQTQCRVLQPALSAAHFFGTTLVMPYRLVMNHPYGYISQLGYYRPGSPAPPVGQRVRGCPDPRWFHPSGYWRHN
jgi:hypothetical protein